MEINQTTLKEFRKDFQEAVKALEEKYGIVIQAKGITYEQSQFHFKVEVSNGNSYEDLCEQSFKQYASMFGFSESDYMRTFKDHLGDEYMIVGLNPKKRKNVVVIKSTRTGNQYVCAPSYIPWIAEKYESRYRRMHFCKYCGKTTEGDNADLLCPDCQETFGHTLYSEL